MDLTGLKRSDWLKLGGGALFFMAGFLDWWSLGESVVCPISMAGLGDYFGTVGIAWLIFVAIAVLTVLLHTNKLKLPPSIPTTLLFVLASALGFVLTLFRFLFDGVSGVTLDRGSGAWIGLLGAAAVVAGCVLAFTEGGGNLADLKDIDKIKSELGGITGGAGSSGTTPPPPPPAPGSMPPPPPPTPN